MCSVRKKTSRQDEKRSLSGLLWQQQSQLHVVLVTIPDGLFCEMIGVQEHCFLQAVCKQVRCIGGSS